MNHLYLYNYCTYCIVQMGHDYALAVNYGLSASCEWRNHDRLPAPRKEPVRTQLAIFLLLSLPGHKKYACCNNVTMGLQVSCRLGSHTVLQLHMTHAHTSQTLFPLLPNKILRLCHSAIDGAMIIVEFNKWISFGWSVFSRHMWLQLPT
jgi:hypothetical protein